MKSFLKQFFKNESGASAAEYALILAIVGVALGAAALALSVQIQNSMNRAADQIENCTQGDCTAPPAPTTK
ncbi:Flp family type IVb pilin [Novosphingobium sp.]|jgi:pilus assembly protein Flp/PilA|uniref:Flp family type IVb pilin n=1 Tax=Novosphingobium sp. TaxID=1874826 RepID=UPI0022BDA71F|nr:Flp family type IVb pilin [Novosphingobium sp.]MCZ8018136.1 Flp family type IVb pilin [Novosphingobium sp.]MCZ8033130.1 Flp family type IVb pilin [Novosphingobium sp.]MCZ8051585.1 Flp family type IVb pilin [Novosphingobium sp.]MCZ8060127.1 Flp family type IVb pilin [Novosphingobium sp.]MCZ8231769.1 Flp family type IVb pilin [Novosphingobium sp.]